MENEINLTSTTWKIISKYLNDERETLLVSLIQSNDEVVRAKIQAIDDLLDLPNKQLD